MNFSLSSSSSSVSSSKSVLLDPTTIGDLKFQIGKENKKWFEKTHKRYV